MSEKISLNMSSESFNNSLYKIDFSQTILYEASCYLIPTVAIICSCISLLVIITLKSMKNRRNFHKLIQYEVALNLFIVMSCVKYDPYYLCSYCPARGDSYLNTAYQLYLHSFAYNSITFAKFTFGMLF